MVYYRVKSPSTGRWFRSPFRGVVDDMEEAHLYAGSDPWLKNMAAASLKQGYKLILRQAYKAEPNA